MLKRNWRIFFMLITLIVDSISVFVAGVLAFIIRQNIHGVVFYPTEKFVAIGLMVWLVMLAMATSLGVYRATHQANKSQQSILAAKAFFFSIPAIFSILYLIQWTAFPRIFTILFFLFIPVSYSIGRKFLNRINRFMQQKGFGRHNTLIFGYENGGAEILSRFTSFPELGYEIKGVITKQWQNVKPLPKRNVVYPRVPLSDLRIVAKEQSRSDSYPFDKICDEWIQRIIGYCPRTAYCDQTALS
jgi:FlaA1/EpsC-like NDP-sugar epimerase